MTVRHLALFAASTLAIASADAAFAQAAPESAPAPATDIQDAQAPAPEIVVTGTRAVGRSRLDTASPVDVLSNADVCARTPLISTSV